MLMMVHGLWKELLILLTEELVAYTSSRLISQPGPNRVAHGISVEGVSPKIQVPVRSMEFSIIFLIIVQSDAMRIIKLFGAKKSGMRLALTEIHREI